MEEKKLESIKLSLGLLLKFHSNMQKLLIKKGLLLKLGQKNKDTI